MSVLLFRWHQPHRRRPGGYLFAADSPGNFARQATLALEAYGLDPEGGEVRLMAPRCRLCVPPHVGALVSWDRLRPFSPLEGTLAIEEILAFAAIRLWGQAEEWLRAAVPVGPDAKR